MQAQLGKTTIEVNGSYIYIQAFGREMFIKREERFSWRPFVQRNERTGEREIWALGFYAVI